MAAMAMAVVFGAVVVGVVLVVSGVIHRRLGDGHGWRDKNACSKQSEKFAHRLRSACVYLDVSCCWRVNSFESRGQAFQDWRCF